MGGAIGAFIAFGQTYGKEASGTLAPSTYWGRLSYQVRGDQAECRSVYRNYDCRCNHCVVLSSTLACRSI
jgi:hypothetical protein